MSSGRRGESFRDTTEPAFGDAPAVSLQSPLAEPRSQRGRHASGRAHQDAEPHEHQGSHTERRAPRDARSQSPEFGSGMSATLPSPSEDARPVEHLEVLIEADKWLVQRLRSDVGALDEALLRLEESCRFEEREAIRERCECERIGQERQHLAQQLGASRQQLGGLKIEHQGLHAESVLLRRDPEHYSREVAFLRRLLDEGLRDTQALQQSIEYLEQSNQSLLAHTSSLEEARREVLEQVRIEREALERERREAERAKQAYASLRVGGAAGGGLEQLTRHGSPASAGASGPPRSADSIQQPRMADGAANGHGGALAPSWHSGLASVGGGSPSSEHRRSAAASAAGGDMPPPRMVVEQPGPRMSPGPRGREGV